MRNKRNLKAHELIGLDVEVINSSSYYLIGLKGKIIDETKNTFLVKTKKGIKRIPKKGNIFLFNLRNMHVKIKGDEICFRPEERTKKVMR